MEFLTKYITPDDFKTYFGIDLGVELKNGANPSDTANAFIIRIEKSVEIFLNATFDRNIREEFERFTNYQKEMYQLALLYQAKYVYDNGDIMGDSGYNIEQGEIASNRTLEMKSISLLAQKCLINCGLWCRKINMRERTRLL